jgi:biofilm PGA synthesis protein PgaA
VAGAELRIPALVLRLGASYDLDGISRGGALAEAVIRLSDTWRIEANGETLAPDTPLRALRNGITAAGAALVWRESERREAAAQLRVLRFSDDNVRTIGFLRWTERVWSAPDWKLDLTPYAYATENSRPGGPYFSPSRDLETGLTASVAWVAWRRWERDLVVTGSATFGGYWQEDFGWSPVVALRWENRHALSDALALSYGAGWARRDYDGQSTDAFSFIAGLRWRL